MEALVAFLQDIVSNNPKVSDIRLKFGQREAVIAAIVHCHKEMIRYKVPEELQGNWASVTKFLLPDRPDHIGSKEYENYCEITSTFEGTGSSADDGDVMRFRASLSSNIKGEELVLRPISSRIPSPAEILMPDKFVEYFDKLEDGIVLFVGQACSGKTTSIASLVKARLEKKSEDAITLGDPVEYIYPKNIGESEVSMRQVGLNTESFASGLRAALRMRPDLVVVEEIRDAMSAATGVMAGMTGHLVIGSLHATNAFQGPAKLYSFINNETSGMAGAIGLENIAGCLRAVVAQRLMRNLDDGRIVAVHEILLHNEAVAQKIGRGDFTSLRQEIQTGGELGMQTFAQAIKLRIKEGLLSPRQTIGD